MRRAIIALTLTGAFAVGGLPGSRADWVVVEIPQAPGWVGDTEANDINDSGVVCGMGNYVVNTSSTVFRSDGVTTTELPHLTPADPISLAWGINNDGVICGYSRNATADSMACYWEGTTLYTLPYPADANTNSDFRAYDINDNDVIVGYYWNTLGDRTAFYYKDGTSYSLDAKIRAAGLTGLQIASAVNNNNVLCGNADDTSGTATAYTYDIDADVLTVIGRIGLDDCSATALNDLGHTIGRGKYYEWDTFFRAVTYDGSWHFVDDAELAHQRVGGINNNGRMVVYSGSSSTRASWYSDAAGPGSRVYFDAPGWVSLNVMNINNSDWVVGYGDAPAAGDETRGFIIKPPPGDADHDADLDLHDFGEWQVCFAPSGPVPVGCETLDSEPDGDIDLVDFSVFPPAMTGPGM
jgi:hypothetical protein